MATITTTIREPKTFQQIQDQQNEFGKQNALESLNNNISKLIKAINARDQIKETEQDRQLKMNQLELSKLQLRRAQLGLANDEKYYEDYSRRWNSNNGIGTSIGVDKNSSQNAEAMALSIATGGILNPVIVKQILLPILNPTMKVLSKTTGILASFPGLIPMISRKMSGKTSSAIESDPDRKLHGKLDQILGAIKDKTKSSKTKEDKEEGILSKLLTALLLGAAGVFAASNLFGKSNQEIFKILKDYGPAMIAGYALGGWKGALVAGGLVLGYKAWQELIGETEKTPEQIADDNAALVKINSYIPIEFLKFKNIGHFKATVAGLMLGGLKGAAAGWAFGKYAKTIKKWLGKVPDNDDEDNQDGKTTEENEKTWLKTLADKLGLDSSEAVLPVLAGFYLNGIRGAAFGYLSGQILSEVSLAKEYRDAITKGDEITAQKIKEEMDDAQYRATLSGALAGFMHGGVHGALIGGMISFFSAELAEAYGISGSFSGALNTVLDQNYLGVPAEVWMGCISLASLAMNMPGANVKTVVAAALIGALGGFIADRYRSKELIEKAGFEANWDWSSGSYRIGDTDLRIEDIRQEARNNLTAARKLWTEEDVQKETARLLKEKYHVLNVAELEEKQREIDYNNLNTQIQQVESKQNEHIDEKELKKRGVWQTMAFWKSDEEVIEENLKEREEELEEQKREIVRNFLDRLEKDGIIAEKPSEGDVPDLLGEGRELLKGGKQILKYKGLSNEQINAIEKTLNNPYDISNKDAQLVIEGIKIIDKARMRAAEKAEKERQNAEEFQCKKQEENTTAVTNLTTSLNTLNENVSKLPNPTDDTEYPQTTPTPWAPQPVNAGLNGYKFR